MRGLPAWALKGGAVCLTVLAAVGSAGYVGAHVKNQSAPLRPALHPNTAIQSSGQSLGTLHLAPGMRTTSDQAVTDSLPS